MTTNSEIRYEYANQNDLVQIALLHMPKDDPNCNKKLLNFYKDKVDFLFSDKDSKIIVARQGSVLAGFIILSQNITYMKEPTYAWRRIMIWCLNLLSGRYGFNRFILHKAVNVIRGKLIPAPSEYVVRDAGLAKVVSLIVSQQYRGQGIGRQLLKNAMDELSNKGIKKVIATPLCSNSAAIHLYTSLGFNKTGYTWESTGKSFVLTKKL